MVLLSLMPQLYAENVTGVLQRGEFRMNPRGLRPGGRSIDIQIKINIKVNGRGRGRPRHIGCV
jgi:hypothetical protein